MNLHEIEVLSTVVLPVCKHQVPTVTRMWVPGGWVYTTYDYTETPEVTIYKTSVFVPQPHAF
jgi:hypothetical protein